MSRSHALGGLFRDVASVAMLWPEPDITVVHSFSLNLTGLSSVFRESLEQKIFKLV